MDVLLQAFNLFDTDKSGSIDESELRNAMKVGQWIIVLLIGVGFQCIQRGGPEDGGGDRSRWFRYDRIPWVRGDDEEEDGFNAPQYVELEDKNVEVEIEKAFNYFDDDNEVDLFGV